MSGHQRFMYVCSECADNYPEGCGHFDRNDLREMPDGKWLCEGCFDDTSQADRGNLDENKFIGWNDLPAPPGSHADLVKALEEIAKGQGAFSRDPLTHASNTIDDMKAIATDALATLTARKVG